MAAMAIRETYTLLTNTISSNLIFLEVLFLYKDEKIEASPVRLYSHYYSSNFSVLANFLHCSNPGLISSNKKFDNISERYLIVSQGPT